MTRILAVVCLALSLAGCVYGYGYPYGYGGGYPRTTGPQGDTPGATGSY